MKAALLALLGLMPSTALAATVSVDSLVSTVVYLVIIALIFWAIWWFLGYVGVPEPFNKVIRVLIGLAALVIVVNILLGMAGHPLVTFR